MIRVGLIEPRRLRNSWAFRPYVRARGWFRECGIDFTFEPPYDVAFVARDSYLDKNLPLRKSVEMGLKFLGGLHGEYILLDTQDSTSLIGSVDVFRESRALLLLKTCYLRDFDLYRKGWASGRYYWGPGEYAVPDIDELRGKMRLTGSNWLTHYPHKVLSRSNDKLFDVAAMFSCENAEPSLEHGLDQTPLYNNHRSAFLRELDSCPYRVSRLAKGQRVPLEEYYSRMARSRLVLAPFGYGEIAARDIQSGVLGSILLKPDVSHVDTIPDIYQPGTTYVPVKHDASDLNKAIEETLDNYETLREEMPNTLLREFATQADPERFAQHTRDLLDEVL